MSSFYAKCVKSEFLLKLLLLDDLISLKYLLTWLEDRCVLILHQILHHSEEGKKKKKTNKEPFVNP